MINVLLNALVPIFALMALGYFAGWIRDVDNHHVAELNALVMDFALPASLFVATASTSRSLLLAQWPLLLVFIVSMLALYTLSYWMQRRLFGLGSSEASVQAINISLPNYAAAGVLAIGLIALLPIDRDTARAAILLCALPSGFFGVLFGLRYGVKSHVAGSTLIVSSLASVVTVSVALVLTAGW
jgi:predicted permease